MKTLIRYTFVMPDVIEFAKKLLEDNEEITVCDEEIIVPDLGKDYDGIPESEVGLCSSGLKYFMNFVETSCFEANKPIDAYKE